MVQKEVSSDARIRLLHWLARRRSGSRTGLEWLKGALRRLPGRPFEVNKLWLLRLEGAPQPDPRYLRGKATVRVGTPADVSGLSQCEGKKAEVFLSRFEANDVCLVAEADNRIIGYAWYTYASSYHDSYFDFIVQVPADSMFGYDGFIIPEYRLTGAWLKIQGILGSWMTKSGKTAVLTAIEYSNRGSLATHLRFGYEPCASVWIVRMLRRTLSVERSVR
jgi:hypothetical protein